MSRAARAAAVLAAALLAGVGCGDDGSGDDARSAYEAALNKYFAEEIPATDAYEEEAEEAGDLDEFADVLEAGLDGSDRRFAAFRSAADPPQDIAAVHAELLDTIATELRLGDEYVAAARAGDEELIEELDAELEPVLVRFPDLQRRFAAAGYDVELPDP